MTKLFAAAGWLLFTFVTVATLSPVRERPEIAAAHFEHFAAYFILGSVFSFAYPRHVRRVVLIVVGGAVLLETLQLVTPDRHGRFIDALVKAAGAFSGIGITWLFRAIIQSASKTPN